MTGPNVNPEVAAIAKERGVSLTTAYTILRRERIAAIDPGRIPQAIRDRILVAIGILERDQNPDSVMVTEAMQRMGYSENDHSVTHVLWSLQKTEHVRFRVSGRRGLHNITLTAKGAERARMAAVGTLAVDTPIERAVAGVPPQDAREQYDRAHPRASHVNGEILEREIEDERRMAYEGVTVEDEAAPIAPTIEPTEPGSTDPDQGQSSGDDPLADYPLVRDLLTRAKAEAAYVTVAKAVEALGEDDMALTLLGKVQMTPLEEEVARLLADLGVAS